jgi:molybdopterin-binding protein
VIRLTDLRLRLGPFELGPLTLDIPAGSHTLLIGPTGSGKTSILETIAGHLLPAGGRVEIGGRDASGLRPDERGIGFVYQDAALFPHLTVRENVAYGGADEAAVADLSAAFGLASLLGQHPATLSGGERQRVALARALARAPRILLLDEPFAALDPALRDATRREVARRVGAAGITVLHVSHDFDEALRWGDQAAVLFGGTIAQRGTPDAVFRGPATAEIARFIGIGNVLSGVVRRTGAEEGGRFPAEFAAGALALAVVADGEGARHAVIRPEDIVVGRDPLPATRNQLTARVTRLERAGPVTYIHLDAGHPLIAVVTGPHAAALGLSEGSTVALAIKATAITIL